jgi:hypothetical protein
VPDYQRRFSSYDEVQNEFVESNRVPGLIQFGGEPALGNYASFDFVRNKNGTPFRFIGEVHGYTFAEGGVQVVLLFFDPEERVARLLFDWS